MNDLVQAAMWRWANYPDLTEKAVALLLVALAVLLFVRLVRWVAYRMSED